MILKSPNQVHQRDYTFQVIPVTDGNRTQVLVVVNIDYKVAFSISALVSFRNSYLANEKSYRNTRNMS